MKSPLFKKEIRRKLLKIKEHFDLCDISRLKDSDGKQFTLIQTHAFDFIQRMLVYVVISNSLQKVMLKRSFLRLYQLIALQLLFQF